MNESKTYNDCEICSTLKDVEEHNKLWSKEIDLLPPTAGKLQNILYYQGAYLQKCPLCGTYYKDISWNELFSDGWTEFVKLERISITMTVYYLIQGNLFAELKNLALSKKENAKVILTEIMKIYKDSWINKDLITKNGEELNELKNFCNEILSS